MNVSLVGKRIALAFLCLVGSFVNAENNIASLISERSSVIAFVNARIIDGTGAPAKSGQTLIISDGRIIKTGSDNQIKIPQNAKKISLEGKSLLPGWVMHHQHLYKADDENPSILNQQPIKFPKLYLSAGITSARTTGSIEPYTDLSVKEGIDAGDIIGPDFDLTAPYLEGEAALLQLHTLKGPEEAREMVRYWAGQGFTSFKAYSHITQDQLAAAVDESHKLGLKITAHLCSVTYREAAEIGVDQLEHGFFPATDFVADKKLDECPNVLDGLKTIAELKPESEQVQELFRYLIEKGVVITSTLDVTARLLKNHRLPFAEKLMSSGKALEASFWRAGGKLVVGTDPTGIGALPHYGSLRSIELLAQAGIPPLDVIKIATQNGAQAMGVADDRGTIALGKRADLIVIDGDPSKNIEDIYNIDLVFKNGVGYKSLALKASANEALEGLTDADIRN